MIISKSNGRSDKPDGKVKNTTKPIRRGSETKPVQRVKTKTKRTRSGKKSKKIDTSSKSVQNNDNTATVAQSQIVGDNDNAVRLAGALAEEAISEYESDFESGDDSDSEMMSNPLTTDQVSKEDHSCSELNIDLNSEDDCNLEDVLDENSAAFNNDDYIQVQHDPHQIVSALHRCVSEGGNTPSPHLVDTGRTHCRVKSDVSANIHLTDIQGDVHEGMIAQKDPQAGSWKAKKPPVGANNKQYAVCKLNT